MEEEMNKKISQKLEENLVVVDESRRARELIESGSSMSQ